MTRQNRGVFLPLAMFFFANACTYPWMFVSELGMSQKWVTGFEAFGEAVIFILPPALLFYVRALTNSSKVKFNVKQLWHLLPFFIGFCTFVMILILPVEARVRLLDGPEVLAMSELPAGVLLIGMFLGYPVLSIAYIIVISLTLIKYRQKLKDLYASTVGKELHWVSWAVFLFALDWLMSFASGTVDIFGYASFYNDPVESLVDLALFWLLAVWALRPISIEKDLVSASENITQHNAGKYGRAALSQERKAVIARKIETAMIELKLYLEPDISLLRLARAIKEQPNNVSQTLNSALGSTFFDYVNGWRIRASLSEIKLARKNIITVAYDVGFNSQSSFYKAFKIEMGVTPLAYRKANRLPDANKVELS